MITYDLLSTLSDKFVIQDINLFTINLILAVILLGVGIFLGKFVKFLLRKIIEKAEVEKTTRKSFIDLLLTVAKWSIYIMFVALALDQLGIPQLTSWLTSILVVIPALVGALLLIAVGFAIAAYLRDIIEESGILGWKILSMIFFYFILYVFLVFAIKTALISQDRDTVNIIVIVLTTIVAAAIAYWHVKKSS
jgi:MFS family permease